MNRRKNILKAKADAVSSWHSPLPLDGKRRDAAAPADENLVKMLDRLPCAAVIAAGNGKLVHANPAWSELAGQLETGSQAGSWLDSVHQDDRARIERAWKSAFGLKQNFDARFRLRQPSDANFALKASGMPLTIGESNRSQYLITFVADADSDELAERLKRTEQLFNQAQATANMGTWRLKLPEQTMEWSQQIFAIHGMPPGEAPALKQAIKYYPDGAARQLHDAITTAYRNSGSFDIETDFIDHWGEKKRVRNMGQTEMVGGKAVSVFGICQDVTDRYRLETRLRQAANTDELTGVANRTHYDKFLADLILRNETFKLYLIDLDGFKWVNDSMGHPAGDALLISVADRLEQLENVELVARLGGDEFAVITKNDDLESDSFRPQLLQCFEVPFEIGPKKVRVAASIGCAEWPTHGEDVEQLIQNADIALYQAKVSVNETLCCFNKRLSSYLDSKKNLVQDLRTALSNQEFVLHFQPLYDLRKRKIVSFEALLRWESPVRGMVAPGEFVPTLDETGLVVPIGGWVLREACQVASTWSPDIRVSVNVSPLQLQEKNFQDLVVQALAQSQIAPERLELEITENVFFENVIDIKKKLERIRAIGVRLSLDDFGTGYSSLSYLQSLSFDSVKIDRSFIDDLEVNKDSRAIIRSIINLADAIKFETIAEGVEKPEQLGFLEQEGCDKVQGYLFSEPVPQSRIAKLIESISARNS